MRSERIPERNPDPGAAEYLNKLFVEEKNLNHNCKQQALLESAKLGKERISLTSYEGYLLQFFFQRVKPQFIVEVGTLTGHSGLWLLEALEPGGTLVTLEKDETHAERAKKILTERAQELGKNVEVRVGDAVTTFSDLVTQMNSQQQGVCGVFIDANKAQYGTYLELALKCLRPGGVLVADNVLLRGAVYGATDTPFSANQAQVLQEFNSTLARHPDFATAIIPTQEGLLVAYLHERT